MCRGEITENKHQDRYIPEDYDGNSESRKLNSQQQGDDCCGCGCGCGLVSKIGDRIKKIFKPKSQSECMSDALHHSGLKRSAVPSPGINPATTTTTTTLSGENADPLTVSKKLDSKTLNDFFKTNSQLTQVTTNLSQVCSDEELTLKEKQEGTPEPYSERSESEYDGSRKLQVGWDSVAMLEKGKGGEFLFSKMFRYNPEIQGFIEQNLNVAEEAFKVEEITTQDVDTCTVIVIINKTMDKVLFAHLGNKEYDSFYTIINTMNEKIGVLLVSHVKNEPTCEEQDWTSAIKDKLGPNEFWAFHRTSNRGLKLGPDEINTRHKWVSFSLDELKFTAEVNKYEPSGKNNQKLSEGLVEYAVKSKA